MNISSLLSQTKTLLIVGQRTYPYHAAGAQSGYVVVDKVSAGNDASVVFRDAGAIKGEVGIPADDDVHFKVATGSPGSETFVDAVILKNATGYVYVPLWLGIGTVPAQQFHVSSAAGTVARTLGKIENTSGGGAGFEFKGSVSGVTEADWSLMTDIALNGGNNLGIFDNVAGYPPRLMIDTNGRIVVGSDTAGAATNNSLDVVGSIRTRGTNYTGLGALNLTGVLSTVGSPTTGTYAVGDVVMDSAVNFYRCTSAGTPGTWTGGGNGVTNALTFNLARNYKVSSGGVIAGGSLGTLTDTSNTFTSADVGKLITVVGAGAAGVDLSTTIATLASSTSVTLTVSATTAVSAATYAYGTDDGPAINSAITAATTLGGTVSLPPGNYAIGTSIAPANNVRIDGAGWGSTILYPFGTTPCIDKIASSGSPLTNAYLSKFCVDGVRQAGAYNVSIKGIFIQYMSQCTVQDVLVRNCVATGIGIDFLTNGTKVDNCIAIGNGRLNQGGGSGAGGNGIGIGVGQHAVEDFVVANCFASGNGRYGIMHEGQVSTATSRGMRYVACYSVSNFGAGFTDAGGSGAQYIGCIAAQNGTDGFSVDNGTVGTTSQPGGNTMFIGCESLANTRYGFTYNPTSTNTTNASGPGNITWVGCKAWNNTSLGWYLNPISGHAVSGLYLTGCDATGNGTSGIEINQSCSDVVLSGCKLRSNGQNSGTNNFGVYVNTGTVTNFQMTGCRVWDDGGTQHQAYAVALASGTTISTGMITGNDFRGNLTGVLSNAGTLTSCVIDKNPGGPYTLTYAATLNTDCSLGDEFEIALTGAATLANPTNMVDGQNMKWRFTQDATGGRVLTLGTAFNGIFTLSTAANAVDYLSATYNAATTNWDISNSRSSLVDFGTGAPGTITGQKVNDVYIDFNTGNFYQYS